MDKFQLTIMKQAIHGPGPLTSDQQYKFVDYFLEQWAVNNYNSTPSKIMRKLYLKLDYSNSTQLTDDINRFRHYIEWHKRYHNG